jgi:Tol biopolymer transport system component
MRQGIVTAQPFDPENGVLSGEQVLAPGADTIGYLPAMYRLGASVSNDGTILASGGSGRFRLSWLSRDGRDLSTLSKPDRYIGLRLSPEGGRASLAITDSLGVLQTWILDLGRGVRTRVSSSTLGAGVWSHDGRRVVVHGARGTSIVSRDSNGAGVEETLAQSDRQINADDCSPDGRYLIYEQAEGDGANGLWVLPLSPVAERKSALYLKGQSNLRNAQFSPDGKWVVYASTEAGQPEIFVQSFPTPEARVQVSSGGGNFPRWRKDGKELFYRALDGKLMAAAVRAGGSTLQFATPAPLFRLTDPVGLHAYPYDVSADGQRILALVPEASEGAAPLTIFLNWQAGLKK